MNDKANDKAIDALLLGIALDQDCTQVRNAFGRASRDTRAQAIALGLVVAEIGEPVRLSPAGYKRAWAIVDAIAKGN